MDARIRMTLAAALLAGFACAQTRLRPGDTLGPWSSNRACLTAVYVNGNLFSTVAGNGTLTVPPLPPSLCGLTVQICFLTACPEGPSSSLCSNYVLVCN